MFRREDAHWWYAGMRDAALGLLRSALAGEPPLRILDAGCGTGGTTVRLEKFGDVVGIDLATEAVERAASRGLHHLLKGSIERLPFRDAAFDLVTSFEVVYHLGVGDDLRAFREFRRVLTPGGRLLLRLPGHDWLRGEHDRLVHTRHRYTRAEVANKLAAAEFEVEYLTWANTVLFPPAAAKRLLERPSENAEPDLWQPPPALNRLLQSCLAVESVAFARRWQLPFGLSVLALARAR